MNNQTKQLKQQLKFIFIFYASFGDRANIQYLKSCRYHKFLIDLFTISNHQQEYCKVTYDLIFKQINRNQSNMSFDTFLDLQVVISNQLQDSDFVNYIQGYIFPLYNFLMEQSYLGEEFKAISEPIDGNIYNNLKSLYDILMQIYKLFFENEKGSNVVSQQKYNQFKEKSEKNLFHFLKQFEICPNVLTKSSSLLLFNFIIESDIQVNIPNQGQVFTFQKFFIFIIKAAILGYKTRNFPSQLHCVNQILEVMEVSEGFRQFQQKTYNTNNSKLTLMLPKNIVQDLIQVQLESSNMIQGSPQQFLKSQTSERLEIDQLDTKRLKRKEILSNNLQIDSYFDKFQHQLMALFQQKSRSSDKSSLSTIKNASFIKLLKELGVIPKYMQASEVELIVIKFTGSKWINDFEQNANLHNNKIQSPNIGFKNHMYKNNHNGAKGKLEYMHFLKVLEIISNKIYGEGNIQTFFENHLIYFLQQIPTEDKYLVDLQRILELKEVIQILEIVHKNLFIYYRIYVDQLGFMNIERFVSFLKDFEIFPELISKNKIYAIFYSMSSINKERISTMSLAQDQQEEELLDQHLFVEALVLIALEIYQNEENIEFKILMLLERMNNSGGPQKIQSIQGHTRQYIQIRSPTGLSWDIMAQLRKKYKKFYQQEVQTTTANNFNTAVQNL